MKIIILASVICVFAFLGLSKVARVLNKPVGEPAPNAGLSHMVQPVQAEAPHNVLTVYNNRPAPGQVADLSSNAIVVASDQPQVEDSHIPQRSYRVWLSSVTASKRGGWSVEAIIDLMSAKITINPGFETFIGANLEDFQATIRRQDEAASVNSVINTTVTLLQGSPVEMEHYDQLPRRVSSTDVAGRTDTVELQNVGLKLVLTAKVVGEVDYVEIVFEDGRITDRTENGEAITTSEKAKLTMPIATDGAVMALRLRRDGKELAKKGFFMIPLQAFDTKSESAFVLFIQRVTPKAEPVSIPEYDFSVAQHNTAVVEQGLTTSPGDVASSSVIENQPQGNNENEN